MSSRTTPDTCATGHASLRDVMDVLGKVVQSAMHLLDVTHGQMPIGRCVDAARPEAAELLRTMHGPFVQQKVPLDHLAALGTWKWSTTTPAVMSADGTDRRASCCTVDCAPVDIQLPSVGRREGTFGASEEDLLVPGIVVAV